MNVVWFMLGYLAIAGVVVYGFGRFLRSVPDEGRPCPLNGDCIENVDGGCKFYSRCLEDLEFMGNWGLKEGEGGME